MEALCDPANLSEAMRRVIANRGAPGVDGMTVQVLAAHWRRHGPTIVCQLLSGTYRPAQVKRVEIPKPDGGVRKLGIPTVMDRMIQQALLHVVEPLWEPTFSDHSYGFRPQRSAQQAVRQAKAYIAARRSWVVDIDLEQFFDRVAQQGRERSALRRAFHAGLDQTILQHPGVQVRPDELENTPIRDPPVQMRTQS